MRVLVFVLIVALLLAAPFIYGAVKAWQEDAVRERTATADPRAVAVRRNHAAMARLLDKWLHDEMTSVVFDDKDAKRGRDLLAAYYQEGTTP